MFIIGMSYHYLMNRFPGTGGSYEYAKKVLGYDHGFLCSWLILLTYAAIIWANATALAIISRYIFGDILCFGFSYQIAGYTVYFGEVLIAVAMLVLCSIICIIGKRLLKWV